MQDRCNVDKLRFSFEITKIIKIDDCLFLKSYSQFVELHAILDLTNAAFKASKLELNIYLFYLLNIYSAALRIFYTFLHVM